MRTELLHHLMSGCKIELEYSCRSVRIRVTYGNKFMEDYLTREEIDSEFEKRLFQMCELSKNLIQEV